MLPTHCDLVSVKSTFASAPDTPTHRVAFAVSAVPWRCSLPTFPQSFRPYMDHDEEENGKACGCDRRSRSQPLAQV